MMLRAKQVAIIHDRPNIEGVFTARVNPEILGIEIVIPDRSAPPEQKSPEKTLYSQTKTPAFRQCTQLTTIARIPLARAAPS